MKNEVIIVNNGSEKHYEVPEFGTITIQVQDGKIIHVERSIKEKIK
ncbi:MULTISPECIES: DUF2292 domain-containing protein [unclassified Enterococcus]|nr:MULTISPECIES: DUF2292 domain-containing protein [unclassified Enterococcus]MBS7576837.1 DUF2292 domain-containing protein [Enterococcus sp. MMGLQ5-2]MBS7584244.1 DUF2292 domain-containing protein [Enterococcus sp. MMGLQ5-1]NPD12100.1 DUF2292 domain-containing protein [Enterococcus sp. MMGLQ5-1]NPD36672.1 DUF2292 domain-containing protein [Enterococcus sp. MMGLQ5-2]